MTLEKITKELGSIADIGGNTCMCGRGEECENCSPRSSKNEMRRRIHLLISKIERDEEESRSQPNT